MPNFERDFWFVFGNAITSASKISRSEAALAFCSVRAIGRVTGNGGKTLKSGIRNDYCGGLSMDVRRVDFGAE